METYQELARRYVRDFGRLTGAEHEAGERSRPELAECILRLNDLYASLETRGRAPFNVKVWQSDLARRMLELRDQKLDTEWRVLRREVSGLMREARFSEAAERMKNLPVDGAMARDQREVLVWLADAASAFLQDLPRRLATDGKDAALMTRDGTKLGEVAGTGPEGIVVAEGGGERTVGWAELAPAPLLHLYEKRLEQIDSPFEKGRRIEAAAAFAELSGLNQDA